MANRRDGVILLHGIGRGASSMGRLERALRNAGYRTLNLDYPARRRDLSAPAAHVQANPESLGARRTRQVGGAPDDAADAEATTLLRWLRRDRRRRWRSRRWRRLRLRVRGGVHGHEREHDTHSPDRTPPHHRADGTCVRFRKQSRAVTMPWRASSVGPRPDRSRVLRSTAWRAPQIV